MIIYHQNYYTLTFLLKKLKTHSLPYILTFNTCPRSISAWTVKHKKHEVAMLFFPPKGAVVLTLKLNADWQRDVGL